MPGMTAHALDDVAAPAALLGQDVVELPHLGQQDGAGHFVHAIVESHEIGHGALAHLGLGGRPQQTEIVKANGPFVQQRVVRNHRSALAGGDHLVELEAEDADVADGGSALALVLAPGELRGIFQDLEPMPAGDVHHGVHVGRRSEQVYDHDGLGLRSDLLLQIHRIDGEGVVVLGEHWQAPVMRMV